MIKDYSLKPINQLNDKKFEAVQFRAQKKIFRHNFLVLLRYLSNFTSISNKWILSIKCDNELAGFVTVVHNILGK